MPNAEGMVPVNSLLSRFNLITRVTKALAGPMKPSWTPVHPLISRCVLQFSESLPPRVSLIRRSVSQSATKPTSSGSGTAAVFAHEMAVCAATRAGVLAPIIKLVMAITAHMSKGVLLTTPVVHFRYYGRGDSWQMALPGCRPGGWPASTWSELLLLDMWPAAGYSSTKSAPVSPRVHST